MRKIRNFLLVLIVLYSVFPQSVLARDIFISANKSSLSPDEDMVVTASASGFIVDEVIYLKGAFFKEGEGNYFGYTRYNNDWIKNSASTLSQRQVKMNEWDFQITVKNDSFDSGFKGSGSYKFKLGYYYMTSGANLSPVNWSSNTLDVALVQPTNTPTPNPTATNSPTSTKTPTPFQTPVPLHTQIIVKPVTRSVSPKITKKPTMGIKKEVLGSAVTRTPEITPVTEVTGRPFIFPPVFLILGVLVIISACGILLFQEWKKQKKLEL